MFHNRPAGEEPAASLCPSCGAVAEADPKPPRTLAFRQGNGVEFGAVCPECGSPLRPPPSPAALAMVAALWLVSILGFAAGMGILRGDSPVLNRASGALFFLPLVLAISITFYWIRRAGGLSGIADKIRTMRSRTDTSSASASERLTSVPPKSSAARWLMVIFLILVLGGVVLLIAGPPQGIKPGDISLKDVSFKGLDPSKILTEGILPGVKLSVVFGVRNPNVIDASVSQMEYDLFLNGVPSGHGTLPNPVLVSANGNADIPTEISISLTSGAQGLLSSIKEGGLTAKVQGSVTLKSSTSSLTAATPFTLERKIL